MNLKFDPVDVVGAGCWDVISRLFLFATSLWMGTGIAAWALKAPDLLESPLDALVLFFLGPAFLLSPIVFLTIPCVLVGLFMFTRTEKELAPRWVIFANVMGLLCLLGYWKSIDYHYVTWPIWILLASMLSVATWFFIQWNRNRWIKELEELKEENRQRRAEMQEQFGTANTNMYGFDEE